MRLEGILLLTMFSILGATTFVDVSALSNHFASRKVCIDDAHDNCGQSSFLSEWVIPVFLSTLAAAQEFVAVILGKDRNEWFAWAWANTIIYPAVCATLYRRYTRRVMNGTMMPITGQWLTVWTVAHNLFMAVISIILLGGLLHSWLIRAGGSMCAGDFWGEPQRIWVDLFFLSKTCEMIDTVLRLLSGRIRINVLLFQMYHHGTQPMLMYITQLAKYDPSVVSFVFNAFAHVTAYLIYAGDSASVAYPRIVKSAPVATVLRFLRRVNPPVQIVQFLVAMVENYYVMATPFGTGCLFNERWPAAFLSAHVFYVVYFIWFMFLVNEYNKIKPTSRAVNRRASFAASDVAYVTGTPYCKRKLSNAD